MFSNVPTDAALSQAVSTTQYTTADQSTFPRPLASYAVSFKQPYLPGSSECTMLLQLITQPSHIYHTTMPTGEACTRSQQTEGMTPYTKVLPAVVPFWCLIKMQMAVGVETTTAHCTELYAQLSPPGQIDQILLMSHAIDVACCSCHPPRHARTQPNTTRAAGLQTCGCKMAMPTMHPAELEPNPAALYYAGLQQHSTGD